MDSWKWCVVLDAGDVGDEVELIGFERGGDGGCRFVGVDVAGVVVETERHGRHDWRETFGQQEIEQRCIDGHNCADVAQIGRIMYLLPRYQQTAVDAA